MKELLHFPWTDPSGKSVELALHWWSNKYGTPVPPRGYIWIIHGIGEHGARYSELASFLTVLGFDVLAPEHPGHGLNRQSGVSTQLISYKKMRSAMTAALDFWRFSGPRSQAGAKSKPWFVMGHSLGGLLALSWVLKAKSEGFQGDFAQAVFVSAPPLRLLLPVPEWKESLAQKLEKIAPYFEMASGIKVDGLSYEAANLAEYREDKLVHGFASPELFLSMEDDARNILAHPADIEIPLALAVGEEDPIVDPATIESYYKSLGTHKALYKFPGNKHEIINDISKRDVYRAIAEWFL
ncbi:MAG: alpha/beta fold hydrolase [Bdellovibrionota bacterium]